MQLPSSIAASGAKLAACESCSHGERQWAMTSGWCAGQHTGNEVELSGTLTVQPCDGISQLPSSVVAAGLKLIASELVQPGRLHDASSAVAELT
eukprot:696034-Prymnesium_polylepis.1